MKHLLPILLLLSACSSGLYSYDLEEVRKATVDEWESRFGSLPDSCSNIWEVREIAVSQIDTCSEKTGSFDGCAYTKSDYYYALNSVPACWRAKIATHELSHFLSRYMWGDPDSDHEKHGIWDNVAGSNSIETAVWHNVGCPNY